MGAELVSRGCIRAVKRGIAAALEILDLLSSHCSRAPAWSIVVGRSLAFLDVDRLPSALNQEQPMSEQTYPSTTQVCGWQDARIQPLATCVADEKADPKRSPKAKPLLERTSTAPPSPAPRHSMH